ncbi:adenylate/guanylate cyclase domain-containing protein [Spirochaetota bacterium]
MGDSIKILLVDDSELVSGMLTQFFESSGYTIVRAKNGVEGIEMVYSEVPDIIILDVDMPLLQGYQVSRLLKQRRGVKDIPILMHTSHSEDRDRYWAVASGADAFITKDFDNLDMLLEMVKKFSGRGKIDVQQITEDAKSISREKIFEMVGTIFDRQLFHSTILNMLGDVGRSIGSLDETISKILNLLKKVCHSHVTVLLLKGSIYPSAYIMPEKNIFKNDVEEFIKVCYNDFNKNFPELNLMKTKKFMIGIEGRDDFENIRHDNKKISSYAAFDLKGNGGAIIGSLHIGNITNNYFSDFISGNIEVFSGGAGIILENSILLNEITGMENKIRTVLSKFVPKDIIDNLVERKSDVDFMTGEKREVAILFSDIRSFTTISENNSAENVVSFLNNLFNVMGKIIEKHGGIIDKFIGDAILAIFGAPKSYDDNSLRAVKAAVEMTKALKEVNIDELELPGGGVNIGIGIHEGNAIVGNIGFSDKFDYTVIGDTVNLASRLEGLTKHYHQHIIVSDSLKDKVEKHVMLREVDNVKVKGKSESTSIYAVELEEEKFDRQFMENYNKGLQLYKMGNFSTAIEYFNKSLVSIPDDFTCAMFIERCERFIKESPENWDGAISLDFK